MCVGEQSLVGIEPQGERNYLTCQDRTGPGLLSHVSWEPPFHSAHDSAHLHSDWSKSVWKQQQITLIRDYLVTSSFFFCLSWVFYCCFLVFWGYNIITFFYLQTPFHTISNSVASFSLIIVGCVVVWWWGDGCGCGCVPKATTCSVCIMLQICIWCQDWAFGIR